jgi:hypothetical protein
MKMGMALPGDALAPKRQKMQAYWNLFQLNGKSHNPHVCYFIL